MAEIIVRTKSGVELLHITNAFVDTSNRKAELDQSTQQRISDAVWEACRREREEFSAAVRNVTPAPSDLGGESVPTRRAPAAPLAR